MPFDWPSRILKSSLRNLTWRPWRSSERWRRSVRRLSPGRPPPRTDNRRFINALLWMARSGARWKDPPPDFGAFRTVKRRCCRWLERGLIDRLFDELGQNADLEWLMLDSTFVRAHQHATGAPKKKGARKPPWAAQGAGFRPSFRRQRCCRQPLPPLGRPRAGKRYGQGARSDRRYQTRRCSGGSSLRRRPFDGRHPGCRRRAAHPAKAPSQAPARPRQDAPSRA